MICEKAADAAFFIPKKNCLCGNQRREQGSVAHAKTKAIFVAG